MHQFASTKSVRAVATACLVQLLFLTTVLAQTPAARTAMEPATLTPAEKVATEHISADYIHKMVERLSSPEMEGRGTGLPGGERAAKFLAEEYAKLGYKPLGDNGGFLQAVKFHSTEVDPSTSVTIGGASLDYAPDFVLLPPMAFDTKSVSGGTVFVGYGVDSTDLNRNDLKDIDVKGKVAIVMGGHPEGVSEQDWAAKANPQAVALKLIGQGAAAIVLTNMQFGNKPYSVIADYLSRRSVSLDAGSAPNFQVPPILLLGDSGAEKIFAASGASFGDVKAKALRGEHVSMDLAKESQMTLTVKRSEVVSYNVVAYLEGSDPTLKKQAVVYSAHYDAFGVGSKGQIYPGAADNALGVAEISAIGKAFAMSKERPRRSIVLLAVTGEEYGLLGARYWAEHPTWPLDDVAAVINFDGIGTEVYAPVGQVVGFGAEFSDLGATFKSVVEASGAKVIEDPMPEEKAFQRSDHYAFVKKGVPALMLLGGPAGETEKWMERARIWLDVDYHQVTDTIKPDWNWDGARDLARMGLVIGMRVASADAAPQWLPDSPYKRPTGANQGSKAAAGGSN